MKAILSNIDSAIATATAPKYHGEVNVIGYTCPCCGAPLVIRSIRQGTLFYPACTGETCERADQGWINLSEENGLWYSEESVYQAIERGLPR